MSGEVSVMLAVFCCSETLLSIWSLHFAMARRRRSPTFLFFLAALFCSPGSIRR